VEFINFNIDADYSKRETVNIVNNAKELL